MLGKLLKYDLENMLNKFLVIFYILTFVASIVTRILFSLEQTTIVYILGQISVGFFFAMIANIIINNFIRIWVRFKETLYEDESYLIHTLPVTKKELYNSKFLTSLITLVISFIVIIIAIFITYYTKERFDIVTSFINNCASMYDVSSFALVGGVVLLLFLELFNGIQAGYFGIIMGHRKNNKKIVYSIFYGFFIYIVSQLLVLAFIFIIGIFNSSIMKLFTSNVVDSGIVSNLMVYSIVIYILIIGLVKFINSKFLTKGVNVD